MKTITIALLVSTCACGGAIEPTTYGSDATDEGSTPVEAGDEPVDASLDVADGGADALVCDFPTGVIECGHGFFYCVVPASGASVPCDSDAGACEPGWSCAPTDFDAALGHVK